MANCFIITNQDGHYWGRGKAWVDGADTARVASFSHRDEASNTVFELSSKDFSLRASIQSITLTDGKLPELTVSDTPLPALEDDDTGSDQETSGSAEPRVENPV